MLHLPQTSFEEKQKSHGRACVGRRGRKEFQKWMQSSQNKARSRVPCMMAGKTCLHLLFIGSSNDQTPEEAASLHKGGVRGRYWSAANLRTCIKELLQPLYLPSLLQDLQKYWLGPHVALQWQHKSARSFKTAGVLEISMAQTGRNWRLDWGQLSAASRK